MHTLLYYILIPLLYGLSYLPMRLLYIFSDILHFILFTVINYRKSVIHENLTRSFPNYPSAKIKEIEKAFQEYFCDLFFETLKTLTIKPEDVMKRVSIENVDVFRGYYKKKQSIIIVMGHFGNWELAGARFGLEKLHKLIVIYHPLKHSKFNNLIVHMRTRLGNELYARADVLRGMIRDKNRITATAFIADQTPTPDNAYWTTFLNQDTPVFTGTEKIARKFNYPVVYVTVKRPKRGHYIIQAETLFEHPEETTENEISKAHTRKLEHDIQQSPEIWLWSHKRWKYKRKEQNYH